MYKQLAAAIALSCVCASAMADYGFEPVAALAPDITGARIVAVGDLTGDGRYDVVVLTAGTQPAYRNMVLLYAQTAAGFALPVAINYAPDPNADYVYGTGLALSDLDADGDLDIVVSYGGYPAAFLSVLRNDGGTFTRGTMPVTEGLQKMKFVDFNGDGHLDLVAQQPYGGIAVFPGDGAAGFGSGSSFPGNFISLVETADLDGDGLKDLVYSTDDTLFVRRNEGAGFSATPRTLMRTGYNSAVAVADFNTDGRIDLLLATNSYPTTRITLFPQGSDGGYRQRNFMPGSPGYYLTSVRAADLDDDGRQDILTFYASSYAGTLSVRLADAPGGFLPAVDQQIGGAADYVLGDINNDGRTDVVLLGPNGAVNYMLGRASPQGVDLAVFLGLNSGAAAIRVENRGDSGAGPYQLSLKLDARAGTIFAGAMPAGCSSYAQWNGTMEYNCTMPALAAGAHDDRVFPFGTSASTASVNLVGKARITYQYPEFRVDNNVAIERIGRTLRAP